MFTPLEVDHELRVSIYTIIFMLCTMTKLKRSHNTPTEGQGGEDV
jgi:hypothetical protein